MAIENYGVWVAQPTRYTTESRNTTDRSPHITLYFQDGTDSNKEYSAAINVKSTDKSDSELAYWLNRTFSGSITSQLTGLAMGFQTASSSGLSLDYVRDNLVDFSQAQILPYSEAGANNDILDDLEPILTDAINAKASVYIFGSSYTTGIHDVHMNQGSPGYDNATHSDGALIFHFPTDGHFEAVFLAFASQEIPTNDSTGEPASGAQTIASLAGSSTSAGSTTTGSTSGNKTGASQFEHHHHHHKHHEQNS